MIPGAWQSPGLEWVSGDDGEQSYELSLLLDRTPEEAMTIGTLAREEAGDWRLDNRSELPLPAMTAPGSLAADAALDILADALLEWIETHRPDLGSTD
jgi:hypothetical protein